MRCRSCGRIEDVAAVVDTTPALRAARDAGFVPETAEVVVVGLCADCAR
jgi:Fe2+ or Zn2+ uptake regulation protein